MTTLAILCAVLAAVVWFVKPRFRWSAQVRVGRGRRRKLLPGVALVFGGFKTWRFGHRPTRRRRAH